MQLESDNFTFEHPNHNHLTPNNDIQPMNGLYKKLFTVEICRERQSTSNGET